MKKIFNFWLMAALVCGLSIGVASCKDDDNDGDGKTPEEQAQEQGTKAMKFYQVVSQLADLSEMTDSTYESQTFEPIIGEESQNDQLTRIVATNDMETAAARFANLTGADVTASTASYTYSDPDVGTLTYTKTTDGSSWATVDVDIKQVPHLTRIVYCTPAQMGENGKFEGTAYYRFGDVIKRRYVSKNLTEVAEYWICVRPAFGPEGKGDSHWISVGMLPEDNMFHHSGSNGTEYYVPTKVCTDTENMQNFAEMLYAMFNPDQWWETLTTPGTTKPKIFNDFTVDSLHLHNKYFWKNVYEGWKEKGIAELAFNMNSLEDLKNTVNTEGLNLLYSGYSWLTTFSWYCELYNICYTNGTGKEANFHKVKTEAIKKNMKDLKFDCHKMGNSLSNYNGFFGDGKHRWVVRYAKGKQLMASGTFNKFEGIVGCTDVWRYNEKYGPWNNLSNTPPKPTPATNNNNDKTKWDRSPFTHRGFYQMGDIYKDENGHRWIVISMAGRDDQNKENNSLVEKDENPVAELVSFEGLTASADKSQVTNLPTFDQAVRATYLLHNLFSNVASQNDEYLKTSPNYVPRLAKHLIENRVVDLRHIFQTVAKPGDNDGRRFNRIASVAYRDASVTNGQPLFRVVNLIGLDDVTNQTSPYHFWTKYVANPDSITITYESTAFGSERILLQHVAQQNYVTKYAKDYFACAPLTVLCGGDNSTLRKPRSQTDARANDVTNYYYNYTTFNNFTFPGGMWYEPVLMMRVAAVYDRGQDDHATVTTDGHTLTLDKPFKWLVVGNDGAEDAQSVEENFYSVYSMLVCEEENMHSQHNFLNGARFTVPSWSQAWQW